MLAILFCLASLWLGSENKPPVRARSVPARPASQTVEEKKIKAFDPVRDGGATPLGNEMIQENRSRRKQAMLNPSMN